MDKQERYYDLKCLHAAFVYYQYNLRILHWKAAGDGFDEAHKVMDEYVDKFNEFIDKTSEIIISTENNPLNYEEIIQELDRSEYSILRVDIKAAYSKEQAYQCVRCMFNTIAEMCNNARKCVADDVASELDSIMYWIRVELAYKTRRRMTMLSSQPKQSEY